MAQNTSTLNTPSEDEKMKLQKIRKQERVLKKSVSSLRLSRVTLARDWQAMTFKASTSRTFWPHKLGQTRFLQRRIDFRIESR